MNKRQKKIILITFLLLIILSSMTMGILLYIGVFGGGDDDNFIKSLGTLPLTFALYLVKQTFDITKKVIHYSKVKEQVETLHKYKKEIIPKKQEPPKRTKRKRF